ncbi:MAG: ABC transporter permease [Dehalococcoidia bacterium]|nr:ABC transporter permease [Dehalococcoidia bacterium]
MRGVGKLAWIETKLFVREPLALLFAFAFPFFMLFVLAGVFGNDVDPTDEENLRVWRGVGPTDYYISTYVGLVMASAGLITLPLRLASYRETGVLRRFRAAGVPLGVVLGAQVLVAIGMAIIGAAGIVVAGRAAYGAQMPESWPLVLVGSAMGLAMFAAIGLLLGAILPTSRAVQGAGLTLFIVMMMISGSGPPREVLTTVMQTVSDGLPLTHLNLLVQDAWLGFGWNTGQALVVVAITVVAGFLAVRFFRWE